MNEPLSDYITLRVRRRDGIVYRFPLTVEGIEDLFLLTITRLYTIINCYDIEAWTSALDNRDNIHRGSEQAVRRLKEVLWIPVRYIDYALFVFLVMLKMYLFGKFANLAFVKLDMVAVTLGSVLLASFWTLWLRRYARWIALWIVNLAISSIVFADLIYFRYFNDFITVPVLTQANQVDSLGGSILALIKPRDLLFFLDLLICIPLVWGFRKRSRAKRPNPLMQRVVLGILVFALGYFFVYYPVNSYTAKYGKNLFINNWWNVSIYNITGLIGFHAFDVKRYINEHVFNEIQVPKEKVQVAKDWFEQHRKQLSEETPLFGIAKNKNVLIVQTEAFQNFVIHKKINGEEITPNLNKLIGESSYFNNFHTQVGQGRTSDAELLVNTSLYPLPTGSVYVRYAHNVYDSLPEILKRHGYETSTFHAYEKSFWNRQMMYQNMKIDHFYGMDDFAPGEIVGWALGDDEMLQQAITKLKEGSKPFYGFAITLSSHHPFTNVTKEHKSLDLGKYEGTMLGDYLHAVHYVDYAFGKAIERLKQEGLWDDTILIMYGDHDNGIKLDADMAAFIGESADELNLERVKDEVPLFVHIPGGQDFAGEYEYATGMIDITPSVLQLLGIKDENGMYHMGENIFDFRNHLTAFRYGSFTDGEVFYKASLDGNFDHGTCYRLDTGEKADNASCKEGYNKSRQQINISDQVIYGNLLRRFMEEQ